MSDLVHRLSQPWPWFVAGPLIGLMVPILLLAGNRLFGVSGTFRHLCAATLPGRVEFFRYDWRRTGFWNLAFALGILIGATIAGLFLAGNADVPLTTTARESLGAIGIHDFRGLVPSELFTWSALATGPGLVLMVGGGFLVGFGSAYAGGCTSGHGVTGLADWQLPSLIAVVGFFAGGLIGTWFILPWLLGG